MGTIPAGSLRVGDYVYYMGVVDSVETTDGMTLVMYDNGDIENLPSNYHCAVWRGK